MWGNLKLHKREGALPSEFLWRKASGALESIERREHFNLAEVQSGSCYKHFMPRKQVLRALRVAWWSSNWELEQPIRQSKENEAAAISIIHWSFQFFLVQKMPKVCWFQLVKCKKGSDAFLILGDSGWRVLLGQKFEGVCGDDLLLSYHIKGQVRSKLKNSVIVCKLS